MSGQAAALLERIAELRCAADDVAETLRDLRGSFDFEPGELDEVESRLDVIYRLRKNTAIPWKKCWNIWRTAARSWMKSNFPAIPLQGWRKITPRR